jgi:hypothetical protein
MQDVLAMVMTESTKGDGLLRTRSWCGFLRECLVGKHQHTQKSETRNHYPNAFMKTNRWDRSPHTLA